MRLRRVLQYLVLPVLGLTAVVAAAGWVTNRDAVVTTSEQPTSTAVVSPAVPTTAGSSTAVPTTAPASSIVDPSLASSTAAPTTVPANTVPPNTAEPSGIFQAATRPGTTFGAAPFLQFSVAVEEGIGINADELADFVDETLADERSWIGDGRHGFERIAEGGTFTLVVAHPQTVDSLCVPLQTAGRFSCARNGWVALNLDRWNGATDFWTASLEEYQRYVVNHEVGHYLGVAHTPCPSAGVLAPVMQQQTKSLDGCLPNGWPFPEAASG